MAGANRTRGLTIDNLRRDHAVLRRQTGIADSAHDHRGQHPTKDLRKCTNGRKRRVQNVRLRRIIEPDHADILRNTEPGIAQCGIDSATNGITAAENCVHRVAAAQHVIWPRSLTSCSLCESTLLISGSTPPLIWANSGLRFRPAFLRISRASKQGLAVGQ
jgi:hypothetical protein